MNQIKSIQLGVIAISIATVPLSSAQTPRTRASGSNQTGAITTTTAAPIRSSPNGNSTRVPQTGINAGTAINVGANTNVGAHAVTNFGVQTGINNQAIGMAGAAKGKVGSSSNSTVAAQTGINPAAGINTKANTNAGAQTGTAAGTDSTGDKKNTLPQIFIESTPSPNLSTPTPAPTPIPNPTPIPSPSLGPSPSPTP